MDVVIMMVAAPLWIPLMLVLAIIVKVTSKGAVFFKQKRLGKNRKLFMIYKFRFCENSAWTSFRRFLIF
jgi:O-antigen biosynthesis protein WbqP